MLSLPSLSNCRTISPTRLHLFSFLFWLKKEEGFSQAFPPFTLTPAPLFPVTLSRFVTCSEDSHWLPLTRLYSVLPAGDLWQSEHFRTNLTFQHPLKSSFFDRNETVCFALDTNRSVPIHVPDCDRVSRGRLWFLYMFLSFIFFFQFCF